ncbi:glutathione S-transferase N-terminal domain-containing protein [Parerythrobacter jejuensis]|uniref:Glutathione S-transferase n=1 Tax=Parerythrobacter jejuensis TaxID=795812 RepID=A0A845AMC4_9SPHN|nr:glutathione S-transferase N-terminal domain-containing protein [Parerythrobacter jejuensis]MXP31410.1 glutathione S-transferase [Parerythrobacter jejuensis]
MYTLHGALASPYSMKMRALLRYRRITHIWAHGASARDAQSQVRAPVIPVLEYPDGSFANDSTPLIYDLERRHTGRSVIPDDPGQAFLAHLIEDFADEWLTKAMFGYRWLEDVDQIQMSHWLAFDAFKGGGLDTIESFASTFRERQVGRMALVGCTRENFALIEASTRRLLRALEDHVVNQHWFFGTRPSLAEFGIYGQFSQLGVDPTAQTMMRAEFPDTYRWLLHVDDASDIEGAWSAPVEPAPPVVEAFLSEVGRVYVPFLQANAAAAQAGKETFRFEVDGLPYEQGTFKYQLKCLADLRQRFAALPDETRERIVPLLNATGCREFLG